ncbi:MAG TPA: response regulator [Pseudomonadales bacterium]
MLGQYYRSNPLATRLTLLIIASSTLIALLAIAVMLHRQYRMDVDALQQRIDTIQSVSLSSLSQSLWEFNDEHTRIMLRSMVQMADIVHAEVSANNWDGSQRLISSGRRPATGQHLVSKVDIVSNHLDHDKLGELTVLASLDGVYQRLWQGARFIILSTAITIFVITGIVLLLIKQLLTRHLDRISTYTQSLRLDEQIEPLQLKRHRRHVPDELDAVVIAINQMHCDLLAQQKQQIRLMQQRVEAEAASQTKSRFLATMSHEIRTPMNGIIGMLGLIELGQLDKKQAYYLSIVKQSSETLLAIINDILDFSRIEAGKLELASNDFELENLIEECAQLYTASVKEKGINLLVMIPVDVPRFLRGDALRIRQILLNLLSNALKFTEQGYISLTVSVIGDQSDGRTLLRFAVADSGCGIEADSQALLFEPFEQAAQGRKQGQSGTGLGLAICKRLVGMMGGEMGVDSAPGQGAEFWFCLPLVVLQQDVQHDQAHVAAMREHLAGKHLLLVDDDKLFASMVATYAQTDNMVFSHCGSLAECRQLVSGQMPPVDVFMIDMGLPDGSGIMLIQWLREQDRYRETPVILLSAMADTLNDADIERLMVSAALSKPLTPRRLQHAMASLLGYCEPAPQPRRFADLSALNVLVAEDNDMNVAVIRAMLEQFRVNYQIASNGKQALDIYKMSSDSLDVILMDCEMPFMDGFSATQAIRQWEKLEEVEQVYIVALTAHHTVEHQQLALDAGMDEYLAKPVSITALEEILMFLSMRKAQ